MKVRILLTTFLFLVFMLFFSCDTTEPGGDNPKPPGYQEDIPWLSLADSPWPMNHHDPQNTGRSQYVGPSAGIVEWVYRIPPQNGGFYSSASIDLNNRILVGTTRRDSVLSGFNDLGQLVWQFTPSPDSRYIRTTPLIGKDGTIYFGSSQSETLYAINSAGDLKWSIPNAGTMSTGINIGLDGTLYFLSTDRTLYAISKSGQVIWTLSNSDFHWGEFKSVVFSPDGQTLYVPAREKSLHAVNIESQTIKWSFGNDNSDASPLVDSQGNIYALTRVDSIGTGLFCLNPSGQIKWFILEEASWDPIKYQDPTMDREGNIYFGFDNLYSVNHDGEVNWKQKFDGVIYSPIVSDVDGNVYVVITQESLYARLVFALDKNGNVMWEAEVPHDNYGVWSPVVTDKNKLIIISYEGRYIYSIK